MYASVTVVAALAGAVATTPKASAAAAVIARELTIFLFI
jgi:hypothetical protein